LFDLSNTPVMTSIWAVLSFSKKEPVGKSWVNGALTGSSQMMKEQMLKHNCSSENFIWIANPLLVLSWNPSVHLHTTTYIYMWFIMEPMCCGKMFCCPNSISI
jgi:hypothetical protein